MTDAPDLDKLARRYMDLWQDQMAAMVNDPKLADSMAQAYRLTVQGAAAIAQATGIKARSGETHAPNQDTAAAQPASPAGSAPSAVPPVVPGDDALVLARRVAELEERVARLEAALGAAGGEPAPKPRRRRS
jgi:hypothetical protein